MGGDKDDSHNPFEDGDSVPIPSNKREQDKDPFALGNRKLQRDAEDPFSPTDDDVERDVDEELEEDSSSSSDI